MEWLYNRKFMAPILASVATLLTTIVVAVWPQFPFSDQIVLQFLMWVWAAGLGIPAADALYDQSRNLIELANSVKSKG